MNGVADSTYAIGASTVGGTIVIGGTSGTGAMTFGSSDAASQIVNIGTGSGATQTVNIGGGAGVNTINIGTGATGLETIHIGDDASLVNVITIGGAASALTLSGGIMGATPLIFEGSTNNTIETILAVTDPTVGDRTITLPNASGTVNPNNVAAETATDTLTVDQLYGMTITNTGQAGAVVYTLPAPAVGMEFTVFLTEAADVDINAATGTQILVLTNATADAISSAATAGNFITLRAISTTEWINVGSSGTWTDVN